MMRKQLSMGRRNLNARVKQFRNTDIQKLIMDLVKNLNKMEETQLKEKDAPSGWIIKRKIHNFHDENNKLLNQILFQNQVISKGAQEIYNRITTPQKGYAFKPLDNTKPKVLSLSSMKNDWETLSNWEKKLKEYIQSGHQDPEANQHTPAVRTILKSFLDENIRQRTERNLDLANSVDKLFGVLEKEEQIFWPLDKRLKSFFASTRKSSDDPMGFLAELRKKAKFCKVSTIIDNCIKCQNCDNMVKVDPDDEAAIENIIIQAFFRGVNNNPFLAYITDETGRTNDEPSINVINNLHLQFTASSRLDYKNPSGAKIQKAEPKKKNKQSEHCFICYFRGHKSTVCRNKPGGEWNPNGEKTFKKPSWWNSKLPDPALSKQSEKKKMKKCKEEELEEAANEKEDKEENNEGENFSEEDSEGDVMDKKVKKAATNKKTGINSIRVNIKKTQETQNVTAYYRYDVKITGKKAKRQKIFNDSGSGLDTVGAMKVEKDGATLVREVPDDLDVVDFNSNPVKIIGYAYYWISEPGKYNYKKKKFFVTPAVEDEELLTSKEDMDSIKL